MSRHIPRHLAALLLVLFLTAPAAGREEHQHQHPSHGEQEAAGVGLKERLGETIPLGLRFRDEAGDEVTLGGLIDGPTVIAPVYYHCPNVCSFLQMSLARALPKMRLDPLEDYRVLSISFDPEETPTLARESQQIYLGAMKDPFPEAGWEFLTGEPEAIDRLLDAAGFRVKRQGEDFLHPVALFVVNREGRIVRYLHGTSVLPMDLTLALTEAREGRIGATIAKMAQFCFSYDPESRGYVFNLFRVAAVVILLTLGAFLAVLIFTGRKPRT